MRIAILRNTLLTLLATACLATLAGAGTPTPLGINRSAMPDTVLDWSGFSGRVWRDGRVFISGQPDSAALADANAHGVSCVVNLRTPAETSDRKRVPFDEAALAASLGLEYVNLPMGDDAHPYTTAAVDSLAVILARQDGNVLLHCTVGWRATHMWVAYLVRHQGWPFDEALARGEHIALSESPFSGLLGRPVTLELAP